MAVALALRERATLQRAVSQEAQGEGIASVLPRRQAVRGWPAVAPFARRIACHRPRAIWRHGRVAVHPARVRSRIPRCRT
jgi:hypothetical protein